MKKVIFYITATAAMALFTLALLLLAAVDAGAPIFQTYMVIIPLAVASFWLFFIAQGIAIAEGMFYDMEGEDDGDRGIF